MHSAGQVGVWEAEGIGEASGGQAQSLRKLEPLASPAGSLLTPGQAWVFSECPFLQELKGVHKGGEAGALPFMLRSGASSPVHPAPVRGWGHKMGGLALGYLT